MRILGFRRFVIGTALALSVSLLGSSSALAAGADIYGVGAGSHDFGSGMKIAKFAFSAHTGPQGDFGSLKFSIEDPSMGFDMYVDINCVNVVAVGPDQANGFISGRVKKVTPNAFSIERGQQQLFGISDLGNPSDLTPDGFDWWGEVINQSCRVFTPVANTPISQGNITIKVGQ